MAKNRRITITIEPETGRLLKKHAKEGRRRPAHVAQILVAAGLRALDKMERPGDVATLAHHIDGTDRLAPLS